jgi:hypothetical protein
VRFASESATIGGLAPHDVLAPGSAWREILRPIWHRRLSSSIASSNVESAYLEKFDTTLSGTASLPYSIYFGQNGVADIGAACDNAGHAFLNGTRLKFVMQGPRIRERFWLRRTQRSGLARSCRRRRCESPQRRLCSVLPLDPTFAISVFVSVASMR